MLEVFAYISYGVLLAVWVVMARQLRFAATHFTPKGVGAHLTPDDDLPSVTVCIPARNEMHALTECLERVVASTYPKLEIIVLDDASRDSTPILIKSFAHAGVRFVKGEALPTGWLGKNHALQALLKESSGSLILFMDVDTRLAPRSIEYLVRYSLNEGARMVSVLPRREDGWRASVIFSPLRHFWEVLFHRRDAPATASNAWLVERHWLQRQGGFENYRADVQPESRLAALLARSNEYRFIMGSPELGVAYEKKWSSQLATSVRHLFPLFRHDVGAAIIAMLDLLVLLLPVGFVIASIWTGFGYVQLLAIVMSLLYMGLYGWYVRRMWRHGWWLAALLWPVIVLQEVALIIASSIQHRRRAVTWKGRTVRL